MENEDSTIESVPIMELINEVQTETPDESEQPKPQLTKKGRIKKPVSDKKKEHLVKARLAREAPYKKKDEAVMKLKKLKEKGVDINDLLSKLDQVKEESESSEEEEQRKPKKKKHSKKKRVHYEYSSSSDDEEIPLYNSLRRNLWG
jgi:hypothetical protein